MARHRYNVLSLWSLHPFPTMVKVPEAPEVALDDIWRTKAKLDDSFSFSGKGFVRDEMLADHEVIKKVTIDEKIEFWCWVMQQAADRGIQIYVFTWNVFTYGADGKHGVTDDLDNDITKAYFRASVREMVTTYPLLAYDPSLPDSHFERILAARYPTASPPPPHRISSASCKTRHKPCHSSPAFSGATSI